MLSTDKEFGEILEMPKADRTKMEEKIALHTHAHTCAVCARDHNHHHHHHQQQKQQQTTLKVMTHPEKLQVLTE